MELEGLQEGVAARTSGTAREGLFLSAKKAAMPVIPLLNHML